MALLEIPKNPSERDLRAFAGIWFPAFFLLVGSIVGFKLGMWHLVYPVWVLVAIVSVVGVIRPPWMRPIFLGWMYAAFPIGWVVSHTVLAATYYLVMTPIGLAMRLLGRDPMHRKFDKAAASYWIARPTTTEKKRYFRQF